MDTVLRVLFVYVFLMFALRVMGKREFSEFTPMELVVLLLIPDMVGPSILGDDSSLTNAIVAACALMAFVFLNAVLTFTNKKFEKVVESTPSVLAYDGQLVERNLRLERITPDELFSEIQQQGYDRLEQVKWAILQTNGKIAVVPTDTVQ